MICSMLSLLITLAMAVFRCIPFVVLLQVGSAMCMHVGSLLFIFSHSIILFWSGLSMSVSCRLYGKCLYVYDCFLNSLSSGWCLLLSM